MLAAPWAGKAWGEHRRGTTDLSLGALSQANLSAAHVACRCRPRSDRAQLIGLGAGFSSQRGIIGAVAGDDGLSIGPLRHWQGSRPDNRQGR